MRVRSLGQEDHLEKEMATCSSILAWKISWTEEPGRTVHGVTKNQTRLSMHALSCERIVFLCLTDIGLGR